MYLKIIVIGLCFCYFLFRLLFPFLWGQKREKFGRQSLYSVIIIAAISLTSYSLISKITDLELGNRLLHALGGGFLAFLLYFLVVRDGKIFLTKLQFFILGVLVVTFLGVVNEIVEFFMQNYFGIIAATSINDTWLDLISNTVGLLLAAAIFVPFVNFKKNDKI